MHIYMCMDKKKRICNMVQEVSVFIVLEEFKLEILNLSNRIRII